MKKILSLFIFALVFTITPKLSSALDASNILKYLVRQPKTKTDNPPLLILLHGFGSNEKDLFSFADQLPDNFLIISARAPNTLGEESFAWFPVDVSTGKRVINSDEAEKSRTIIISFIEALKKEFHFDQKKIILCGFSQGAIMSYSVALTRPDLIHGIAVMSGRLLDEVKPKIAGKEKLSQLKIFISHGTADQTLSIEYARSSVSFLKLLGLKPVYNEYAEGHSINDKMFHDLLNWLKEN